MLPFLEQLLMFHNPGCEYKIERAVRFIKHIIRNLNEDFSQYFDSLLKGVLHLFQQNQICSYLYLIEVITTVLYKNATFVEKLNNAFNETCLTILSKFTCAEYFEQDPDLTEDFIGMLTRFLKYIPEIFLNSALIPQLLQLVEMAIGIQHKQAAKSVYIFLEELYKIFSNDNPKITAQHALQVQKLRILVMGDTSQKFINKMMFFIS